MKIWLDILSPKQLWMHTSIAQALRQRGHEVLLTSRSYEQLDGLVDSVFEDWGILRVGRWGGGSLEGKLRASAERLSALLDPILKWEPDVAVSSGSVEAARIAYGLRLPHFLVSDTPHSPVNRLTAPISRRVLTPWVIPKEEWARAGADSRQVRFYKALDPWFWLRDFKPDKSVLDELGLKEGGYALLRMPETAAAYVSSEDEAVLSELSRLPETLRDLKLVVLCRYGEQAELARVSLGAKGALIVDKLLPGPSITYYSALFIGGGGTMTQEAAILGVPALSIYPGKLPTVLRFLVRRGLVKHYRSINGMFRDIPRILRRLSELRSAWTARAEKLRRLMRPPEEMVIREIEASSQPAP